MIIGDPTRKNLSYHGFLVWFYDTYRLYVYKLAWKYHNHPDEIEDFIQDIWLKLCSHPKKLESMTKDEHLAYISATVRNAAISLSRKHNCEISLENFPNISYNEAELLNTVLDKQFSIKCFRAIWPTVPQPARELLEKKYFLGESDREIAQALGIKVSSVRMYLLRARKTALAILREHKDILL